MGKNEVDSYVTCNLSGVIMFDKEAGNIYTWPKDTFCCGTKGIFPKWVGSRSFCKGPKECILLKESSFFYPPDKVIWIDIVDDDSWPELKKQFKSIDSVEVTAVVMEHLSEMKRLWGL